MFFQLRNLIFAAVALSAATSQAAPTVDAESNLESRGLVKRAQLKCSSSPEHLQIITDAYAEGKTLASVASAYITEHGPTDPLYISYFGNASVATVQGILDKVANENSSRFQLICNTDADPNCWCHAGSSTVAYTHEHWIKGTTIYYGETYFCSQWYGRASLTQFCAGSSPPRGSTVVHELTHALAHTHDYASGCSNTRNLASSNPDRAAQNAENYGCFVQQTYRQTQCS